FILGRINAPELVLDHKSAGGFLAALIADLQGDRLGRCAREKNWNFATEAEILSSLADIKSKLGFALAGVAAVQAKDPIFQFEPAESLLHRLLIERHQVEPFVGNQALARTRHFLRVWTFCFEPCGHA